MSRTRFGFCFARSGNVNETNDSPTPNPGMYLGFGLAGVPVDQTVKNLSAMQETSFTVSVNITMNVPSSHHRNLTHI